MIVTSPIRVPPSIHVEPKHVESYIEEKGRGITEESTKLCLPVVADPLTHTMGPILPHYVLPKIHTAIQINELHAVLVVGSHNRSSPALITGNEKANKPFNWQRPTATLIDTPEGRVLQLNVLPGQAYVEHYAALVATYFASQASAGIRTPSVHYILPSFHACAPLFAASNLSLLGEVDIAILGYVDKFPNCTGLGSWETGTGLGSEDNLFAWKKRTLSNGRRVAFIGCTVCYWGDIGGQLIRALQVHNNIQEAIYVGKLGTLDERYIPNSILATGSCSMFPDGSMVKWTSVLEKAVKGAHGVVDGVHFTGATSLTETKKWTQDWKDKVTWVDPEIGHMARVSQEIDVGFGFLHVVSDNLAREGLEGLVDERKVTIVADRMKLVEEVDRVLERHFLEIENQDAEEDRTLNR